MIHDTDKTYRVPMSAGSEEPSAWDDDVPSIADQERTLAFLAAQERDEYRVRLHTAMMEASRQASLALRRGRRLSNRRHIATGLTIFAVLLMLVGVGIMPPEGDPNAPSWVTWVLLVTGLAIFGWTRILFAEIEAKGGKL